MRYLKRQGDKGWGDTLFIKDTDPNFVYDNVYFEASGRSCVINSNEPKNYFPDLIFRNCQFVAELDSKWGHRLYGLSDYTIDSCLFDGFGKETEGHAVYSDLCGRTVIQGSTFLANGGQGLQLLFRKVSAPNTWTTTEDPPAKDIIIKDCKFQNNGWNPGRGASQIAIYAPGPKANVSIANCRIVCNWERSGLPASYYNGKKSNSRGAIWVVAIGYDEEWYKIRRETPFTCGDVHIDNCFVHHVDMDRELVAIKGAPSIKITRSYFADGIITLDDPQLEGKEAQSILVENCTGNAILKVRGQIVGSISQGYRDNR